MSHDVSYCSSSGATRKCRISLNGWKAKSLIPRWEVEMSILRKGLSGVLWVITYLVGQWQWQPPEWIAQIGDLFSRSRQYLRSNPTRAKQLLVALVILVGGLVWYWTQPKPHYVTVTVHAPGLTEYDERGIASIKPLRIEFSEPVAPLESVEKAVTTGIELSPAVAGRWFWESDRVLQFTPQNDWPVGGEFTVRFARQGLFHERAQLEDDRLEFRSQPFSASFAENQFYQDPRDPSLKKVVAAVSFSHPVDAQEFERRISLSTPDDAEYLGLAVGSRQFTVVYDKLKLKAFIHSAALGMPRDDSRLQIRVDRGIRAARGGNETEAALETVVTIPGRYSLRFYNASMTIVDNARFEPEQILLLKSSSPVAERSLLEKVSAYVLPERHPNQEEENRNPYQWASPDQIGGDILSMSEPLRVSYVPSQEGGDTSHGFKFLAPVDRFLYVVVTEGVQGIGGYVSAKPFVATIKVAPYRKALTFLGKGALLSLSGEKKIGFLVRDIERVEVEIGRVLANQLHHIAPESWDYSHPNVAYMEDKLVERFSSIREYTGKAPGKPTYDSIDLGRYLQETPTAPYGLFLLHLRVAPPKPSPGEPEPPPYMYYRERNIQDNRLILITDLGIITKTSKDGSRDVFVQSIRSGLPAEGVRVEVLGRNGEPVMSTSTDATGRASLARFNDLRRERTPVMIVARRGSDLSFIPVTTSDRRLNFSRFDTGGAENAPSAQQLSTYLFTDRGIYRPGESAHLGLITRTADWKATLSGLPIEVEITDPNRTVVSHNSVKLSANAFDEISYELEPTAFTGTYQADAYLVKDPKRRELLGSTSFRVQLFEPDRMKVRLELSDRPIEGWLTPEEVKAKIEVAHLFGEPAGNRRVEGEMSLTPVLRRFSKHTDYRFQIGEGLPEPYHETLAPGVTNDAGILEFNLLLDRFVGRAYQLNVLARAFEAEGGRSVSAQASAIISDAAFLVGIKPDGDLRFVRRSSQRRAHWIAVDRQLNLVAASGLTLEWVQRQFVSVLTQQGDQTYRYISQPREIVRESKIINIAATGSDLEIPTGEPGDFILVLRDSSGRELNRLSFTVAGEANLSQLLERNAELQVQLNKDAYAGGETMEVSIRAPYSGSGLITIERERVFHHQWFRTSTTSTVQRVTLPRDFEGNGYVNVQFVRDPSSEEIFLSPLSYGVASFSADLSARQQPVRLTVVATTKPGVPLSIRLVPTESSRVAVFAVDEGILQVARYRTPDPLGYFYQKRMLEVQTNQILDLILPEFQQFLTSAAPGGDDASAFVRNLNPFQKKRKPAVVFWSGLVDVNPSGREFSYPVPDYFNGRLRIIAIAVSPRRVGVASASTEVKADFILTPNVPTSVSPGDQFSVSVGVFNNTTGEQEPLRVEAEGDAGISSLGPNGVNLEVASKREGTAEFQFRANARLGSSTLRFLVRRGSSEVRVEEGVGVRPSSPYRTQISLGRFETGEKTEPLKRTLYGEERKVEAAVSSMPLVWIQGLTAYLEDYPYLCTEQLVSKGFSALLLTSRPELGSARGDPQTSFAHTVALLQSRQNPAGGLGLWTSSFETAEFPTLYAVHFLIESKDRGQRIPDGLLQRLNDWLIQFASTPAPSLYQARLRAYAVYLIARQGIRPTAALANVEQELTRRYPQTWSGDLAAAYLAATYRLMQRNNDAERMVGNVPWAFQRADWDPENYYDAPVHNAQLLYLLARHFPSRMNSVPMRILEDMSASVNNQALNSLSASYTVLALESYAIAATETGRLGIREISADGTARPLTLSLGKIQKSDVSEGSKSLLFSKEGMRQAYFSISEKGYDRSPATTEIKQGVEIFREFLDGAGNPLSRARVGEEFLVRVRVRATQPDHYSQVAVVDLLPGGVEPVIEVQPSSDSSAPGYDPAIQSNRPSNLPVGVPGKSNWRPQFIDVRDDRLIIYGVATPTASTFVYRVKATNPGTFQVSPILVEGMYQRNINGLGLTGKLEIVKP